MKNIRKIKSLNIISNEILIFLLSVTILNIIFPSQILFKILRWSIVVAEIILVGIILISLRYPVKSAYNPFYRVIEIHLNNVAKGSPRVFYKGCVETIVESKEKGLDVLFYTWHVKKEKLKSIFGDAIIIVEPSKLEKYFNMFFSYCKGIVPRPLPNPYLKCYIKVDQLSDQTLNRLNRFIKETKKIS